MNSVEEGISSILHSMITTSIDKDYGDIDPAEKVSIVFHEFTRTHEEILSGSSPITKSSLWVYTVGGLFLILIIILIVVILLRRKSTDTYVVEESIDQEEPREIPDLM